MQKPDYIKDLEKDFKKLSEAQDEIKRNHDENQSLNVEMLGTLKSIDHTLRGTDQDPGGLVQEVHNNTDCVQSMKRNQAKRDGLVGSLVASLSLGLTIAWNAIMNRPG